MHYLEPVGDEDQRFFVTVFEHHDADGASLDVAIVRRRSWELLTVEQARDLADGLLDAADIAEQHGQELEASPSLNSPDEPR
jgi:hypothetical protein